MFFKTNRHFQPKYATVEEWKSSVTLLYLVLSQINQSRRFVQNYSDRFNIGGQKGGGIQ